MTVTQPSDNALLVEFTPAEFALFQAAVGSGTIVGVTADTPPAAALQAFLEMALNGMEGALDAALRDQIKGLLGGATTPTLQSIRALLA